MPASALAEELHQRRHADLLRSARDRIRRIDAEHGNAHLEEVLEEIAVVAGELHHETVRAEREPLARHLGVALRVCEPLVGVGGKVDIVAEQLLRRHIVVDLHQPAHIAHLGAKRVALLVAGLGHRREERIGRRLQPQIRHGGGEGPAAGAAGGYQAGHLIAIGANPAKASTVRHRRPTVR